MRKVRFRDADGNVECLWAEHLGEDTYQLDNSPWFAYGVSWKDVVRAVPTIDGDTMPDFQEVVRVLGNILWNDCPMPSTIRIPMAMP